MSRFFDLPTHPLVEKLGWGLVHFLWQGTVIAVLLSLALWMLRRCSANVRYLTALTALLILVASVAITSCFVSATITPYDSLTTTETSATNSTPIVSTASDAESPLVTETYSDVPLDSPNDVTVQPPGAVEPITTAPLPQETTAHLNDSISLSVASTMNQLLQDRIALSIRPSLPWVCLAWLLGVTAIFSRHLGACVSLWRLKNIGISPVPATVRETLERIAIRWRIRRHVQVFVSTRVSVPSTLGLLRPLILLPGSVLTGLTPQQLEAVLAHELAHIRRHDFLLNLLQTTVETLLFYHPAVWWISRRIRVERENCCDDLALSVSGDRYRCLGWKSYVKAMQIWHRLPAGGGTVQT